MIAPKANELSAYLSLHQVGARVGLAYGTIRNLRSQGRLPEPDLILEGRFRRWLATTIDEWNEDRR